LINIFICENLGGKIKIKKYNFSFKIIYLFILIWTKYEKDNNDYKNKIKSKDHS
jgi:hypothetical protein